MKRRRERVAPCIYRWVKSGGNLLAITREREGETEKKRTRRGGKNKERRKVTAIFTIAKPA